MIVRRSAKMKVRQLGGPRFDIVQIEVYWLFWIIPIYTRERIVKTNAMG